LHAVFISLPQRQKAMAVCDDIQPGGEGGIFPEILEMIECLQQGFLCQVKRFVGIFHQREAFLKNFFVIPIIQFTEGIGVVCQDGGDQFFVGFADFGFHTRGFEMMPKDGPSQPRRVEYKSVF